MLLILHEFPRVDATRSACRFALPRWHRGGHGLDRETILTAIAAEMASVAISIPLQHPP